MLKSREVINNLLLKDEVEIQYAKDMLDDFYDYLTYKLKDDEKIDEIDEEIYNIAICSKNTINFAENIMSKFYNGEPLVLRGSTESYKAWDLYGENLLYNNWELYTDYYIDPDSCEGEVTIDTIDSSYDEEIFMMMFEEYIPFENLEEIFIQDGDETYLYSKLLEELAKLINENYKSK